MSLAMDDGGRCLLDVINDPQLLQTFLENGGNAGNQAAQHAAAANSAKSAHPNTGHASGPLPIRSPINSTSISWPQSSVHLTTQRGNPSISVVASPQLLQMPLQQVVQTVGGVPQVLLTQQRSNVSLQSSGVQPGQIVQIIQTPSGPAAQIVQTHTPVSQVQPVTPVSTSKSSASNTARSNKQILPKPPGSNGISQSTVKQTQQTPVQQSNARTMITNLTQAAPNVATPLASLPGVQPQGAPQFILGPGGQPGFIATGSQGTFLLNQLVQGLGSQFLIQGNIGNVAGPVQLTLRPQTSQVVTVSSASGTCITSQANTPLLSALASSGAGQTLQRNQPTSQTIVIPNQSSSTAVSAGGMMMAAPQLINSRGQNIILTRPQGLINSTFQNATGHHTMPQLLQIQTPNGPMLIALQATPAPQQNISAGTTYSHPSTIPNNTFLPLHQGQATGIQGGTQGMASAHPTLHTILTSQLENLGGLQQIQTQTIPTSSTIVLTQSSTSMPSHHQTHITQTSVSNLNASNTSCVPQNKTQAPSVNLAELLKESGILPELSPPSSPTTVVHPPSENTECNGTSIPQHQITQQNGQQTVLMMPGQNPQNIIMSPNNTPQLRLALAPDGSVILHPSIPQTQITPTKQFQQIQQQQQQTETLPCPLKFSEALKDTCGPGSSQPSPDSTTPTLDSTLPTVSVSSTPVSTARTITASSMISGSQQNKSALVEKLKVVPAVKTQEILSSNVSHTKQESKQSLIPLTVQHINSTNENQEQILVKKEIQQEKCDFKPIIVSVPSSNSSSFTSNINMTTSSPNTAVIRINKSCDNLVQTSTLPVVLTSSAVVSPDKAKGTTVTSSCSTTTTTSSTSLVDKNGVPLVQLISNQEFLDSQKSLVEVKSQPQNVESKKVTIPSQIPSLNLPQQKQNLVTLLKQNPVNQSQSIRFITPPNGAASNTSGTTTFQVGNQLITITTPTKQLQTIQTIPNQANLQTTQTVLKPHTQITSGTPTYIQVVRLQTPPANFPSQPVNNSVRPSSAKSEPLLEIEKQKPKPKLFQQQLSADQAAALKPDTKTPFRSRGDACKRLLRYHVFNSHTPSKTQLALVDHEFELFSREILKKKQSLLNEYRLLVLKQSIKSASSWEYVQLDKMFLAEERASLDADKDLVLQGKSLDLPPPPESWSQIIRASVEEEEERLLANRKRKSYVLDEVIKFEDQEEDESEDEDEDSEEDDDEEDEAEAMSKYLGGASSHNFYNDINYDNEIGLSTSDLSSIETPFHRNDNDLYHESCTESNWKSNGFIPANQTDSLNWSRFGMPETQSAVDAILSDDEDVPNLSVDLGSIGNLVDDEDDDEDDDDEDDDDDDDEHSRQPQDVQMECAINSILEEPPYFQLNHHQQQSQPQHHQHHHHQQQQQHQHQHQHQTQQFRPTYPLPHSHSLHGMRSSGSLMSEFASSHRIPVVSNPALDETQLDEAVKSILS